MDLVFNCPHCRQELEVEASAAGEQISCPTCNTLITVPAASQESVKPPVPPASIPVGDRTFAVPLTSQQMMPLIQRPPPPLEAAARESSHKLRIKTIRHGDCRESGHDNFDAAVSEELSRIGEENIVSINPIQYSSIDMSSQKVVSDYGVLIVFKG